MIDNNNIGEDEYAHFIDYAQQEHYLASVVTLPPPHDLEAAAERSTKQITANEIANMISMYEPLSLSKLSKKGAEIHEASMGRVSPRHMTNRRSSSHFREIPANTIPETEDNDEGDDSSEEAKVGESGTTQNASAAAGSGGADDQAEQANAAAGNGINASEL